MSSPTFWTIQRCPNCPGDNEDENALLDDGDGVPGLIGGWWEGWDYLAGNVSPGDTVTVLEPDMRSAAELGYEEAPHGWGPYYDPDVHGPLSPGEKIPPGWRFDTDQRIWKHESSL